MAITAIDRDYGVSPSIVRITSSDPYDAVIISGYLTAQALNIYDLNGGYFNFNSTDCVCMSCSTGIYFFELSSDFSSLISLNPENGNVNLGTADQLAYYAAAGNTISGIGPLTNGQLLIGSTGVAPVPANIIGSGGVTVNNSPGGINISGVGGGIGWNNVTGTTQQMVADAAYVSDNAGLVTLTMPVLSAFGTVISVVGNGAGGWLIAQNAGQNIQVGSSSTTVGVTGSIASSNRYNSLDLVCVTANTTWVTVGAPQGILTIS